MEYKKKFIHFLSINGSGNHLIIDILKNYKISRVPDDIDRLVALLILKKNNFFEAILDEVPLAKLNEYQKYLFNKYKINIDINNLSDEEIITNFLNHFIGKEMDTPEQRKKNDLYLVHTPGYLIFEQEIISKNKKIFFNIDMIKQANELFDNSLMKMGYQRKKVDILRNPIDIYLSQKERYSNFEDKIAIQRINAYFYQIKNDKNTSFIKYEEINKIYNLLASYKISQKIQIENIFFQPQKNKYLNYYNFNLDKFREIFLHSLNNFEYSELPKPNILKYFFFKIKKSFDELKLIYLIYLKKYPYKGKLNHSKINKFSKFIIKILSLIKKN